MKVKVIKSYSGKEGWCVKGTILDVDKERAELLIKEGRAVKVKKPKNSKVEKEIKVIGPEEIK